MQPAMDYSSKNAHTLGDLSLSIEISKLEMTMRLCFCWENCCFLPWAFISSGCWVG